MRDSSNMHLAKECLTPNNLKTTMLLIRSFTSSLMERIQIYYLRFLFIVILIAGDSRILSKCYFSFIECRMFIEIVRKIVSSNYEHNILILSYNPILTISLCGEYLTKLMSNLFSNLFKLYRNQLI